MLNDYYGDIKNDYLEFLDNSNSVNQKKTAARNVIQNLVASFFTDQDISKQYDEHYQNKESHNDPKFKNRYSNQYYFLTQKKIIKRKLKSAFDFIWQEASEFGNPHKNKFGTGLDNTIQFHLFLNQILEWFEKVNDTNLKYLVSPKMENSDNIETIKKTEQKTENKEITSLKENNQKLLKEKEKLERKLIIQTKTERELNKDLSLNSTSENKSLIEEKNKTIKKNKRLTIVSLVLGTILFLGVFYLFSIGNDLKSKELNIKSLTNSKKQIEEHIRKKNSTIDSLKRVVLVTGSKQETNHGFKNEFKGNVGTVNNVKSVKNLDDLD